MKFAIPFAALALAAVPASAEVVERTTVVHEGRTVAVSYEPTIRSSFRQINMGPRSAMTCHWTSTVSVQRTALDAQGKPIAALQRAVAGEETRSGRSLGPCTTVSDRTEIGFAGGDAALRSHLAAAASADAPQLRSELASLAALSGSDGHAR